MCVFREGYALNFCNLKIFKKTNWRPLLTLICRISVKTVPDITRPLKHNIRFQGGLCHENFQIDSIHMADLLPLLTLICVISEKTVQDSWAIDMKGCICRFTKWQIHPFIPKEAINYHKTKCETPCEDTP